MAGATARPGFRRGPPGGVTVFANARINKQHHNPASYHECKNTRHRDAAATCTYRRTLAVSMSLGTVRKRCMKNRFLIAIPKATYSIHPNNIFTMKYPFKFYYLSVNTKSISIHNRMVNDASKPQNIRFLD